jgi:hypothetical protein
MQQAPLSLLSDIAPELPDSLREMQPLFLAVICGCNAGLFREALHEIYIPRIQRGETYFAANVLSGHRDADPRDFVGSRQYHVPIC